MLLQLRKIMLRAVRREACGLECGASSGGSLKRLESASFYMVGRRKLRLGRSWSESKKPKTKRSSMSF